MLHNHYKIEPRGILGTPCLPGGNCSDYNAVCTQNVCMCRNKFYEKNSICSKYQYRNIFHTKQFAA